MTNKRKFNPPQCLLALAPAAIEAEFPAAAPKTELTPALAVVSVRGPLLGHTDDFFDSYEGIRSRVALALASDAPTVVLLLDSPGGVAAGCFELSRDLRAAAKRAGKTLLAYVDGSACSAAYALACACERIYVGESASAGSIGIVEALADQTAANRAHGIRVEVVTSGQRKADGNPHTALTKEALEASRARVDQLAAQFFALVGEARGMSPAKVRALEAGTFIGSEAVRTGLADGVATLDEVIARVGKASPRGPSATKPATAPAAGAMAIAGGSPASAPKPAARAVTVHTTPKPTAPAPAQKEPEMSITALKKQIKALEDSQRQAYLATRPHLPHYLRDALQGQPMRRVIATVKAWEGEQAPSHGVQDPELARLDRIMGVANVSASAVVHQGTVSHFGRAPEVEADAVALARMDAVMGLAGESTAVIHTELQTILGAPRPA